MGSDDCLAEGAGRLPSFADPTDLSNDCPTRERFEYVDPPGFPMLNPFVPVSGMGLVRYRRGLRARSTVGEAVADVSPHFLKELRQHSRLVRAIMAYGTDDERRAHLVAHLGQAYRIPGETVGEKYQTLVGYVSMAWGMIREVTERYVPEMLHAPLTRDGRSDSMNDPVELLMSCADPQVGGSDRLVTIRAFKMRLVLVLSQELLGLGLGVGLIERVNAAERALVELLERRFFVPGVYDWVDVRVAVDPRNGRCVAVLGADGCAPDRTEVRRAPFTVRYFRHGGRLVPVFFDPDKKTLPSLLLKMISRGKRTPQAVPDIMRFLMVCRNRRELGLCLERMQCEVFPVGGTSGNYFSNRRALRAASSDSSSTEHLFEKDDHFVMLPDGTPYPVEGQYMTLRDWIQAATPEYPGNHMRFKRRQVLHSLKVLFPYEVFGIDWESHDIVGLFDL